MQVIYKNTITEKIIKAQRDACIKNKQIDFIKVTEKEAEEIYKQNISHLMPPSMVSKSLTIGLTEFIRRGRFRLFGVDILWDVPDEQF